MKTKILIFASLFLAGMIFTSCQKDNSLYDETQVAQANLQAPAPDKTALTANDPHWGDISSDPITNYPDPFSVTTTIRYILKDASWVRLAVYNDNAGLEAGVYKAKFNSTGLPPGKYFARLQVNAGTYSVVFIEEMTKSLGIDDKDQTPIDD